jgi:exodeoxyribonuclease VIII
MTTHVILDFETFGLGEKAVLLALGACTFDPATGEIGAEFYAGIDPRTQQGRDIDPSTVIWWLKQDQAARDKITHAVSLADTLEQGIPEGTPEEEIDELYKNAAHSVQNVARSFIAWFDTLGDDVLVWTNGAVDHAWLQSMMDYCGYKNPVPYRAQRDYRTLKGLFRDVKADDYGVAHNALDDAIKQAKHTVRIMRHMAELTIGPVEDA